MSKSAFHHLTPGPLVVAGGIGTRSHERIPFPLADIARDGDGAEVPRSRCVHESLISSAPHRCARQSADRAGAVYTDMPGMTSANVDATGPKANSERRRCIRSSVAARLR